MWSYNRRRYLDAIPDALAWEVHDLVAACPERRRLAHHIGSSVAVLASAQPFSGQTRCRLARWTQASQAG